MKKLSEREEEIMSILWSKGPLFAREIVEAMPEPRPHFNTVATFLNGLVAKGWLRKELLGNAYRYEAVKELEGYRKQSLRNMVSRFFGGSMFNLVSTLTRDDELSADEVRELLDMIEKKNDKD